MSSTTLPRVQAYTPTFNPYTNTLQSPSRSSTSIPRSQTSPHQPRIPHLPQPLDSEWVSERIHEHPNDFRFLLQNPNMLDISNKLTEF